MSDSVNKYRVRCLFEVIDVEVWAKTPPTVCPNNNAHAIDQALTTIVDTVDTNEVSIKEEQTPTGGHYQAKTFAADVPAAAGWSDLIAISFPVAITALGGETHCAPGCALDEIELVVVPDLVIGALLADVAVSDSVISVSPTVIANMDLGYHLVLGAGGTKESLGSVVAIDIANGTVTTKYAAAFAHAAGDVAMRTIHLSEVMELVPGWTMSIGRGKIGGTYIPANAPMVLRYNNVDGAAKRFVVQMEYLY